MLTTAPERKRHALQFSLLDCDDHLGLTKQWLYRPHFGALGDAHDCTFYDRRISRKPITRASDASGPIVFHLSKCKALQAPFRIGMSGQTFRVVRAGERTSIEGKPITNKVPSAMPDHEYKLMRPDLTHIELAASSQPPRGVRKDRVCLFSEPRNGFSSGCDQRRSNRGSGRSGQRGQLSSARVS